jgi:hypothetical protein
MRDGVHAGISEHVGELLALAQDVNKYLSFISNNLL